MGNYFIREDEASLIKNIFPLDDCSEGHTQNYQKAQSFFNFIVMLMLITRFLYLNFTVLFIDFIPIIILFIVIIVMTLYTTYIVNMIIILNIIRIRLLL